MPRGKTKASLALIQTAHDIAERNHPLTVRGICYKLFTRGIIPDMSTKSTKKVSRLLTDAREQNLLGWSDNWRWIVDETREAERVAMWRDPRSLMECAIDGYRRNNWREQPVKVEVWSEKGTVRGVLAPVLKELALTFRVMHGYGSYTALREGAEEAQRTARGGWGFHIVYVGDMDPSGMGMSELDVPGRMSRYGARDFVIERAALDPDIDCIPALPSFPASDKKLDARYEWFIENYGDRAWEIDAMDEVTLRNRVRAAVTARMDMAAWRHSLAIEAAEVESMQSYIDVLEEQFDM